jgi:putative glutamine amidotransferase
MKIIIGITASEARYENYPLWMKGSDEDIDVIKLSQENAKDIKKCDGIVLSGGIDTHPKFYSNPRTDYPLAPEKFDVARDEFELSVFEYAQEKTIPVLAICRGMQLVNVALGGNLIQDIEEQHKNNHRRIGFVDGIHEIAVNPNSLLHQITGVENGMINSAHHQGLDKIANNLAANSYSVDGIVEGIEWKIKEHKPFLLGVQWHPERLAQTEPENPFAKNIRLQFLKAVKNK